MKKYEYNTKVSKALPIIEGLKGVFATNNIIYEYVDETKIVKMSISSKEDWGKVTEEDIKGINEQIKSWARNNNVEIVYIVWKRT